MLSNLSPTNDVIIKISKRDYKIELLFASKLSGTSELAKEVESLKDEDAVQSLNPIDLLRNYELGVQENWSVEAVAETIASTLETKYGLLVRRVRDSVNLKTFDQAITPAEPEPQQTFTIFTRAD